MYDLFYHNWNNLSSGRAQVPLLWRGAPWRGRGGSTSKYRLDQLPRRYAPPLHRRGTCAVPVLLKNPAGAGLFLLRIRDRTARALRSWSRSQSVAAHQFLSGNAAVAIRVHKADFLRPFRISDFRKVDAAVHEHFLIRPAEPHHFLFAATPAPQHARSGADCDSQNEYDDFLPANAALSAGAFRRHGCRGGFHGGLFDGRLHRFFNRFLLLCHFNSFCF